LQPLVLTLSLYCYLPALHRASIPCSARWLLWEWYQGELC
jgi:hypothetical protein